MESVLNFLKNNTCLSQDDYVVIGLSGGPDSMALLNCLIEFRKDKQFSIVCAHVHHNIRKESDEEAIFVKNYCEEHNVIFEMTKLDYQEKFTEAYGHKKRYEYFEEIINKYNAKYLFTAHHGDDLIETILMRIVRGASLVGYSGFDNIIKKENYTIIRPLISETKDNILEYLHKNNIPYVIDKSNEDTCYTRNRYRKYILPKLKDEDNLVHLKFLEFSNELKEYNDYVEYQVNELYTNIVIDDYIDVLKIKQQQLLIIKKIIYKWLYSIYGDDIELINKKHIDSILNMIDSSKPNMIINIPNYEIIKEDNKINIKYEQDIENYNLLLEDEVNLPNGRKLIIVKESDLSNNFVTHLNSEDVKLPLYVRNYNKGDKMSIKNMVGHKKIKDIFINEKIKISERQSYPVVVDSTGEIIWLPGIKKSSFDSKKNGKYDIILEYH